MKLIVGLGNPGKKYANNRHNLGFMVSDAYVGSIGGSWQKSADLMCDIVKLKDLLVIMPTTFMNESGQAVLAVVNFYKIDPKEILVIHDDLDLEFGKIRLAFNGSSAGHKGVESIIVGLGSVDFGRLRAGVGRPQNLQQDPKDFVLEDFGQEEKKQVPQILKRACEAIQSFLDSGIDATMNRFN